MQRRLRRNVALIVALLSIIAAVAACASTETPEPTPVTATQAPEDLTADLDELEAQVEAGEYADARSELEALVESEPDNAEAHFQLALVYFNLQRYAQARDHFLRSLELDPDRAAAVHHNLGVLAYQTGDLDTAVEEFNAALEADPDDPDTYYQRGAAYLVQAVPNPQAGTTEPDAELLQKAEEDFNRALEIAPGKPEPLVGLANVEMLRGNLEAATELLEEAIEQNPDMREALFALGQVYAQTGQIEQARETLEHFLETDPPEMWAQQAQALLEQLNQE